VLFLVVDIEICPGQDIDEKYEPHHRYEAGDEASMYAD
jgi:hypothetical protein